MLAVMHVLLVRHGQSSNNALEATYGSGKVYQEGRCMDPGLSQLGALQAQLLAQHLGAQLRASRSRVRVLCSSMKRALHTAIPLAQNLDLQLEVRPELHEVKGFFDYAGRHMRGPSRAELLQTCPTCNADAIPKDGQGDETPDEAVARAWTMVQLLRNWAAESEEADSQAPDEKVVVIVAHNDFMGLLCRLLLTPSAKLSSAKTANGLHEESYWPMNNTGVSHIILGVRPPPSAYPADAYLVYWNRSDHLSEDLRSGVMYKNIGFCGAAEWARVGEGGSGLRPKFAERETFRACRRGPSSWEILAFGALLGVTGAMLASSLASRL